MTTKTIHLGPLKIPITEYASQGNAILGIRDSGKSYTATYLAERLLETGIPFVAFDPIGIWKYLRVEGKGKGYQVVVAGGRNGDLPLTPHSAPEIVRAAMRDNIPLVLDLYDMRLSKADWKSIVEQSVRLLLYENGEHGLRHIFIEEAAEFAPQRVGPDQGRVYAEIEKLARMGGNALLGYTLINQRAEEVNKAVLELCDCLFLHRQKGRNSLTALGKWLDIGDVADSKPIIASLPKLPQGECWVWPSGSDTPARVRVPEKNSFHPDRRALTAPAAQGKTYQALDVSEFVTQMSATLESVMAEAKANDPQELKRQVASLTRQLAQAQAAQPAPEPKIVEVPILGPDDIARLEAAAKSLQATASALAKTADAILNAIASAQAPARPAWRTAEFHPAPGARPGVKQAVITVPGTVTATITKTPAENADLLRGERSILEAMARCYPMRLTLSQVGRLADQSLKSSSFKQYVRNLKRRGLLANLGSEYELTPAGMAEIRFTPTIPQSPRDKIDMWRAALLEGERKIFDNVLAQHGRWVDVDAVADATSQSLKSSSFKQYLRNLVRNLLLEKQGERVRVSDMILES